MSQEPLQAHRLPASRGWAWLIDGVALWRRNPRMIMLLAPCYWLLALLSWGIPIVGPILGTLLMLPMQIWIYLLCRAVDQNVSPPNAPRARKIRIHVKGLIRLWVFTVVASVALGLLADVLGNLIFGPLPADLGNVTDVDAATQIAAANSGVLLGRTAILLLVGALPVQMALWFAPVLVGLCDVPPFKSMVFSIIACWRNVGAFSVFTVGSIVALLLLAQIVGLAAMASQILGVVLMLAVLMVGLSVMLCSVYFSIKEIFGDLGARAEVNANV
ncbi:BPSS1780 family membrane protein [Uliginosibacterium sp. sgz301328]|uniref:BPSS1780 family membrane protein n=1 Tax=Uliginosibacterium sp. sgz301328 TaxID=3243764 RepID=UPI00359EA5D1